MWTQLKNPTSNITYTGGWCLSAVQDAFGTDHPYPTAIAQWNGAGTKYGGLPPAGIAVPVFFSFTTEPAGHVAVMFADGRVGSSTQSGTHKGLYMHPNLDNLMKVYKDAGWKMTYLGWKDTVGTQLVVTQGEDMIQDKDNEYARWRDLGWRIRGREMSREEFRASAVGLTWLRAIEILSDGEEAASTQLAQDTGREALRTDWPGQIYGLQDQVKELSAKLAVKPTEVIKEVPVEKIVYQDKIVEREVIKEVVKGDDERSIGDLLSAAFKKLFKVT